MSCTRPPGRVRIETEVRVVAEVTGWLHVEN